MAGDRYVVLGLGTSRSPWFTEVARWATVGSIPAEFVKCVAPEEMFARLTSGRAFSALLVDAATGAVDRDLIDTARRGGVPVLVVDAGPGEWATLGAAGVLPPDLGRTDLLDALREHADPIGSAGDLPVDDPTRPVTPPDGAHGALVAVTGAGGTGSSTVAMGLAQAMGGDGRDALLADLCLDAELAMLHDARDVVPGVQELVDAHRRGRPRPDQVRALTFDVVNRGYHLLLGLRRHRDWTVVRPRTFEAALDGLLTAFTTVVADVDDDVEGEAECGSADVEDRNVMARTVTRRADAVVVVGEPGFKGVHGIVRTVGRLRDHGIPPPRILTVVNRAPRSPRARAELTRGLAELLATGAGPAPDAAPVGPVHLPERRGLDEILRDGGRLPQAVTEPVARAVSDLIDRALAGAPDPAPAPVPVVPGSLGAWSEQGALG